MDLIDDDAPRSNAPEFSVSELSGALKRMIEGEFSHVRVRAELSRISRPGSGHLYVDLKDDRSVIGGVMWKGTVSRLQMRPEEGMEVVAVGRLTTFPGQSRYQMVIEDMSPAGLGALMAMLEKRRATLQAEGLFAAERKRPLPYLPEVIGVVTSPSGAVIRDILHRLSDRFPRQVVVWPVAVQGKDCAAQVARAIQGFNALPAGGPVPRPDLLIVARGGGSVEDLWGFNEEIVVRAAAASQIPLISAVGHETDTTLIDYASDKRAPTPTAAAEMAVPVRAELLGWTADQGARLVRAATGHLGQRGQRLRDLARALPRPVSLVEGPRQRLDAAQDRLPRALTAGVERRGAALARTAGGLRPAMLLGLTREARQKWQASGVRLLPALQRLTISRQEMLARRADRLNAAPLRERLKREAREVMRLSARLDEAFARATGARRERLHALDRLRETMGYRATLARGYAVVRAEGQLVTTAAQAAEAGLLEIEFADARLAALPSATTASAAPRGRKSAKSEPPPEQGTLL